MIRSSLLDISTGKPYAWSMDIASSTQPSGAAMNAEEINRRVRVYLNKVYMWMAIALVVTAAVAAHTANSPEAMAWVCSGTGSLISIVGSLGIIIIMHVMRNKLTSGALTMLFLTYSGLTGLIFGPLISFYTSQSLGLAFGCTAGTFGAMSLYGATTKRNLSTMGRFLFMALIGLLICIFLNMFMGSGMLDFAICIGGVLIFSGLTAYDTQKLIEEGGILQDHQMAKPAIFGALSLYLDFINLFIYLLRLIGNRD